jgi:2-oxoglutarate ferredoxin oxidoreductase subunit alpha
MIQAEDELASIGMVIGANWNGARAFTATSGPGVSLMQEFLGLAYYTETPTVLFDVQRVGPSTGMPTRTQQGDLRSAAYASHGDTRQVCLYPANPEECFEFAVKSFDLADRLQTPVLVLSDIDIGMNDWMCPEFKWDENYVPDRGKVLDAEQLAGMDKFWRYYDHDNDGIPQRTIPGVSSRGAYFARGSGHNQYGGYTEDSRDYQLVLDRLRKKWLTAARLVPAAVIEAAGNELGIVTVGSGDAPVREAIIRLRTQGVHLDYLRVRGFPFGEEVERFLNEHKVNFIVEQNRDAQLRGLLTLETGVEKSRLRSILHYNGMPLAAGYVVDGVMGAVQDQARPAAQLVRQ